MCKPCPPLGRSFRPKGSIASLAIPMQWPTWRRGTMARGEGISSGTLPLPMTVRFACPHPSSSGSPSGVRRGDDVGALATHVSDQQVEGQRPLFFSTGAQQACDGALRPLDEPGNFRCPEG